MTVLDSSGFYLMKEGTDIFKDSSYFQSRNGVATLPGKGRYNLMGVYAFYEQGEHVVIEIEDTTSVVDYVYVERAITLAYGGMDNAAAYRRCGILLNGYNEDFYPNGKPHVRGNFTKGYFKDSLRIFYDNGQIKTYKFRTSKGVLINEFDSLGHKLSVSFLKKTKTHFLGDYKTTEFYENGNTKIIKSVKGGFEYIKEFYPSGQLKIDQDNKKRLEYFENGKLQITYKWKFQQNKLLEDYDCMINKDEYDNGGQLIEHSEYNSWVGKKKSQPELDIRKADRTRLSVKYKDGKEVSGIENKN